MTSVGSPCYGAGSLYSAPEIFAIYLARESGISSAVLVQVNGRGFWFQFSIQARMSASRTGDQPRNSSVLNSKYLLTVDIRKAVIHCKYLQLEMR